MFPSVHNIWLSFSSMGLLCIFQFINEIKEQHKFEIYVAHINHMIREEADEDEKYVQDYCLKNNIVTSWTFKGNSCVAL